MKTFPYILH